MLSFKIQTRRFRFWWHLTFAYINRYRYRYLIAFAIFISILITVAKIWPLISRSNLVSMGYIGNYTIETIPAEILSLVTEPLISIDKSGKPYPKLVSHWTVSEDGKKYVVFLRDGLKWHDDTQVNAEDISIAIENVRLTALNNKSIEFTLPNPISSFPTALNKPVFKANTFYGTGEFRIVDIDRLDNYVKRISLVSKNKNKPRVDIKFYNNEEQALNALKIGEIKSLKVANASTYENWNNLKLNKEVDNSEVITLFFNTEDQVLGSKEIRQGLLHAINRDEMDGVKAQGPISPDSWAFNPAIKRYEFNTAKSLELFSKSATENFSVTLTYAPGLKDIAELIKSDWQAVNVNTEIIEQKSSDIKEFQVLLAVDKLNPDPDQYSLWHSSQSGKTNITRFKDVKIDKLLEDGRSIPEEVKRKEFYADFQRFLVEDLPAAFLYHPYKYQVVYKNAEPLINNL